ncbi:MAG: hypothetical protein A2X46_10350 [Lentisphaerae bacterium GWF2_57_35]|nr:MAG: hypothetical protein A2X46_10350 [Lentisphaerae bacterium GWF2_57_35]
MGSGGARFLCRYAGLIQREAAGILGVGSGAAISHQMRKLCVCIENDKELKRSVKELESRLDLQKGKQGDNMLNSNLRADPDAPQMRPLRR